MTKNLLTSGITAAVVAIVVSILALAGGHSAQPVVDQSPQLGSTIETIRSTFAGGVDMNSNFRDGGLVFKGAFATTSSGTVALSAGNIVGFSTIFFTPQTANATVQLPASTTFPQSFLPRAGDRTEIFFLNASSTTAIGSLVGIGPGTGTLVTVGSTTPASTASTTGQNGMRISILRKPNTDLLFSISPFR